MYELLHKLQSDFRLRTQEIRKPWKKTFKIFETQGERPTDLKWKFAQLH